MRAQCGHKWQRLWQRANGLDGLLEVLFSHLAVVPIRDFFRMPQPLGGNVSGILLGQFGCSAGSHVVPGFRWHLQSGPLVDSLELRPQIGTAPTTAIQVEALRSMLGDDEFFSDFRLVPDILQEWSQFREQRDLSDGLARMMLQLRAADAESIMFKINIAPK